MIKEQWVRLDVLFYFFGRSSFKNYLISQTETVPLTS
jgi:hypothetical protein